MTAINIPDIYGGWYLINFELVKLIKVSSNDGNGDLGISFADQSTQWITIGRNHLEAVDSFAHLCSVLDAQGWTPKLPKSGESDHE
ncbi:hypothetical protein MDN60_002715 [Salmonella enterica]|nr:hypothetical protein [Salmonella enterica]ECE0159426.1 hypothetical protein [Salmonella enterica]EID3924328.1 hypothetical protein [Salmonella enterica]EID7413049.1 hypothetical protein [Salmonella enterica]EIL4708223.1 hypothetical protein [Salmonella enterica]